MGIELTKETNFFTCDVAGCETATSLTFGHPVGWVRLLINWKHAEHTLDYAFLCPQCLKRMLKEIPIVVQEKEGAI